MTALLRAPRLRVLAACLTLLTLAACDSGDPEERLGVSGQWSGVLTNSVDTTRAYPVTLTLNDDISTITGAGTIQLPSETLQFTVTNGLFAAPNLSLTLIFDRPPQGTLSGIVSPGRDHIDGTLGGPGLANGEVELSLSLQRME